MSLVFPKSLLYPEVAPGFALEASGVALDIGAATGACCVPCRAGRSKDSTAISFGTCAVLAICFGTFLIKTVMSTGTLSFEGCCT